MKTSSFAVVIRILVALLLIGVPAQLFSQSSGAPKDTKQANPQNNKGSSDQQGEIELNSTLITTPVLVVDHHNRYITDLGEKNFQIYEDGVSEKIAFFGSAQEPFSAVLMLNTSNPAKKYLKDEQEAAVNFIQQISSQDRVALLTFSAELSSPLPRWSSDQSELTKAIRSTTAEGNTSVVTALTKVVELFKGVKGRKALILFSDDSDSNNDGNQKGLLQQVEELGALIYVVEYSSVQRTGWASVSNTEGGPKWESGTQTHIVSGNSSLLRALADTSGGRLFHGPIVDGKTGTAEKTINPIIEEIRHQYVIGYYPSSTSKNSKYHKIKVKVDRPDVAVRARKGYTGK